jgi:CHAD domain-containing protein
MAKDPVEREAKVEVQDAFELPDLNAVTPGVVARPAPLQHLRAVYFDTEDRRLLAVGVTLRHRRGESEDGGRWTLKLPVAGGHATLDRRELEWDREADDPPARAVQLLVGLTRGEPLVPVASIDTERHRTVLTDGHGRDLAEVDDDRVSAEAAGTASRFREIEVELNGGPPSLVTAVVARLVDAGAVAGNQQPKLQRTLGAASTEEVPVPVGRKALLGDVVVAALESGLERWLGNEPQLRLGEDTEAVHQVRVAARRLRSDLDAMRDLLEPSWQEATLAELRWVAGVLGRVRDLDVLAAWAERESDRSDEWGSGGVEALLSRLATERAAAVDDLDAMLADPRYAALLDSLVSARREPPWGDQEPVSEKRRDRPPAGPTRPAGPELRRLLRRRALKVRKHVGRLGTHPSATELHELRKRAKRLRYNAELSAPVLGGRAVRTAEIAAQLQSVLGDHQDAVVAETWLRRAAAGAGADEAFAAGQLVAAASRRRQDATTQWQPLADALDHKPVRKLLR